MVNKRAAIILFPILAVSGYFILSVIIGPFLIEYFGESVTKFIVTFSTIIILYIFWRMNFYDEQINEDIHQENRAVQRKQSTKRKFYIAMAILSFLMAPFGFAGVLVGKGIGDLPPVYGGGICLVAGVVFLFGAFGG